MDPSAPNQLDPRVPTAALPQTGVVSSGYIPNSAQDSLGTSPSINQTGAESALRYQALPVDPVVGQPSPASVVGTAPGTPLPLKTNPNSTQNTLHIAEIRDGIVIMN